MVSRLFEQLYPRIVVSQSRRRPPAKNPSKRRQAASNRNQRIYAILGVVVAISLIVTIVGPPLVDYLTRQDDDPEVVVDEDSVDPNQTAYLDQIDADPNNYQAMVGLGNYLAQTGKIDEAIVWYERSFDIAPDDWQNRLSFARDLADGEKRADAELQFKKVLAACPGSLQTYFSLGQLYARWVPVARTDEAAQAFNYVVTYGGDSFLVELSQEELSQLGFASPTTGSSMASPISLVGSPVAFVEGCP
jgi:tetratricopeptide (TPR) repeat protein